VRVFPAPTIASDPSVSRHGQVVQGTGDGVGQMPHGIALRQGALLLRFFFGAFLVFSLSIIVLRSPSAPLFSVRVLSFSGVSHRILVCLAVAWRRECKRVFIFALSRLFGIVRV